MLTTHTRYTNMRGNMLMKACGKTFAEECPHFLVYRDGRTYCVYGTGQKGNKG